MIVDGRLTDEERATLRTAAFGAVFLVSNADPGPLAMIRESFAASGVFAGTGGLVREALTTGPLPSLPKDSPVAVEQMVLPQLTRSMEILRDRAPEEATVYRAVVLAAVGAVARADRELHVTETTMVDRITRALDAGA